MRTSTLLTALTAAAAAFTLSVVEPPVAAHCQIPCGIYDDPMRVTMLKEDATTIQKAVTSMGSLVKDSENALAMNQFVRWTTVKDDTATNIQRIVSDYFLTQRVKAVPAGDPGRAAYLDQLAKMDDDMSDDVNDAIEYMPGRIRRQLWSDQAKILLE